jgi:hypothetical protein
MVRLAFANDSLGAYRYFSTITALGTPLNVLVQN